MLKYTIPRKMVSLVFLFVVLCVESGFEAVASGQAAVGQTDRTLTHSGSTIKKQKGKTAPVPVRAPIHARDFVIARGVELWRGNYEFTNIGVNIPDLFLRFLDNRDASAASSLKDAAKAGVRFVRCDGCTRSTQEFRRFSSNRAGWLDAFRRMLTTADDLGISIVPVLLPDIRMIPALEAAGATEARDASTTAYLSPDTASNRLALEYVDTVVGRFKDDPRVLFWEIGDEYNLGADMPLSGGSTDESECYSSDQLRSFFNQVSRSVKAIDKNHLVSAGNGDMRPNSWHLRQAMLAHKSSANRWSFPSQQPADTFAQYSEMITFFAPQGIDIVSVHQTPPGESQVNWLVEDDEHALRLPWSLQAAGSVPAEKSGAPPGKPIFIGEFGQPFWTNGKELPIPWTLDFVRRIRNGPTSVCSLNMWETDESDPRSASISKTPQIANLMSAVNLTLLTANLAAPFNK